MHRFARGAVLAGLTGVVACGGAKPAPAADTTPASPPETSSTPGVVTTGDTVRVRLPAVTQGVAVLDAATALGDSAVEFTFRGDSAAGVEVFYASAPVTQCGSGEPVAVTGPAVLMVRFSPADAHVFDGENATATIAERHRALPGPLLTQMTMICDFEGQVEWALGLSRHAPFTVRSVQPGRILLELHR